jgi:hypothetical protein
LQSSLIGIDSLKKAIKQIKVIKNEKIKSFELLIKEFAESEKITLKLRK